MSAHVPSCLFHHLPSYTTHWYVLISRSFICVSHLLDWILSSFGLVNMYYPELIQYTLNPYYVLIPVLDPRVGVSGLR